MPKITKTTSVQPIHIDHESGLLDLIEAIEAEGGADAADPIMAVNLKLSALENLIEEEHIHVDLIWQSLDEPCGSVQAWLDCLDIHTNGEDEDSVIDPEGAVGSDVAKMLVILTPNLMGKLYRMELIANDN